MRTKQTTISVGISAFNEQQNIKQLLTSIVEQQSEDFTLREVIVISDGSTDNTVSEAESVNDSRIRVIAYEQRAGKVARLRELLSIITGDYFLQIDADVKIADQNFLQVLVTAANVDKADLIFPFSKPAKPKRFFEKVAYLGWEIWETVIVQLGYEKLLFHRCIGACRLFSKKFYTQFALPKTLNSSDDRYSFYFAVDRGLNIQFVPAAVAWYRLPVTAADYLKQMRRFLFNGNSNLEYFPASLIRKYDMVPGRARIQALFRAALNRSPVRLSIYFVTQLYAHLTAHRYAKTKGWDTSVTTKSFE